MSESEEFRELLYEDLKNRSSFMVFVETFTLCAIMLITFIGNGCLLYVFFKHPKLLTTPNYFVVARALSDVLMGTVVMPTAVANSIHGGNYLSNAYCTVAGFTCCWMLSTSLIMVTAVAISRYIRVAKPQVYRRVYRRKRVIAMIIIMWIFGFMKYVLVLLNTKTKLKFLPGRIVCFIASEYDSVNEVFPAVFHVVFILVPSIVISVSYWKVMKAVNTHKFQSNLRCRVSVSQVKITKSILALVCGFVLCWIPSSTIAHVTFYIEVPRKIQMLMTYFTFLSSAINPFIMMASNKGFRNAVLKIFC